MSDEELEPMNTELRDLLRANAPPLGAPKGMEAKLLARLSTAIPGLGSPPSPGGGGGGGGGAGAVAGTGVGVKVAIGVGVASLALAGVAVFGTGGTSETVAVRAPVVTTITASTSAQPESPSRSSDVPTMNVDSLPSAAPAVRAPAVASSDAVAEHAILDEARNALGRGDAAAALAAIERHQARYPNGALGEEREVLAIRALAAAGRTNDAHARAARFKARYPKSLFLPSVEQALGN